MTDTKKQRPRLPQEVKAFARLTTDGRIQNQNGQHSIIPILGPFLQARPTRRKAERTLHIGHLPTTSPRTFTAPDPAGPSAWIAARLPPAPGRSLPAPPEHRAGTGVHRGLPPDWGPPMKSLPPTSRSARSPAKNLLPPGWLPALGLALRASAAAADGRPCRRRRPASARL